MKEATDMQPVNSEKQRLSTIQTMNRTIIPSDWTLKTLRECCLIKGEYGINAASVEYSEELPTYIRITDIDDDGNYSAIKKVSVNHESSGDFILSLGDLLFARTGATVGKTYLYKENDGKLVFAGFLIRFKPNENVLLAEHIKYFTSTKTYWDWVKTVSMRSGQPGINAEEYGSLQIPLPPLPEQRAIATLLSTWDEAISNASQLLQVIENRNKWLMQMLLTGKKRLKGFDDEWKREKLEKYLVKHDEKSAYSNQYPVLTSSRRGIFLQSDYYTRDVASEDNTGYNVVPRGFFTYRHMSDDLVFKFNINSIVDKGIVSTLYPVFTTKNINSFFLLNKLNDGNEFKVHAKEQKQGGSRTYVYFKTLCQLKISLPTLDEQTAIAQVLQTADSEIQLLKTKIEQLKEQKKGLIQVLLTGKKRLKIN